MKKRICIILIVLISALLLAGCEKTKKGPPGWSTQSTQKDKSGDEAKNTSETQPGTEAAPTGTEPGEDPQTGQPGTDPGGTEPGADPQTGQPGTDPGGPDLGTGPQTGQPETDPGDTGPETGTPITGTPPGGVAPIEFAGKTWMDNPSAIEQMAGSVVKLEVYDRNGDRIATGSGFCALDETVLVTAAHVIVNMDYMIATQDDGETFRIDKVLCGSEESDIAICLLPEGKVMPMIPLLTEPPLRGVRVVAIGSQFGMTNLVTFGNIAGTWESDTTSRLVFTAPVSAGNSGGPLLGDDGTVIGIVSGTYDKGQNLNFASPILLALQLYNAAVEE